MKLYLKILLVVLSIITTKLSAQQTSEINPELLCKSWTAKWIAFPGNSITQYGVYLFRKEIIIKTKPVKFIVHVSADNRYKLYINSKYICNGPARSYLFNWAFESIDIAPYLHTGKNIITSVVWNFAEHRPLAQISKQTGFILQGNSDIESICNTDSSWMVFNDISYAPQPVNVEGYFAVGDGEEFNCATHPWRWTEENFTTTPDWKHAKETEIARPVGFLGEYGNTSTHTLHKREIPFMEEKNQRFFKIRRSDLSDIPEGFLKGESSLKISPNSKIKILFDQNELTTAYPVITFSKGSKSIIKLTYAESLFDNNGNKGNRNDIENKHIAGNSDVIICDGGNNRTFQTLWWRAFRYLELDIETGNEPLVINDFHSIFSAYPFKEKASFTCDNPLFQKIWDVGWRTQRLCANETYFDCPYYEQLQYAGDTRIQSLVSTYVSGDSRLVKNAIIALHSSQLPLGINQSRYPCREVQIIPTFSLVWVTMVHDYWLLNGDSAFVRSMLPGIMETLNWFKTRIDTSGMLGRVEWWNFVDWVNSKGWDNGAPPAIYDGNSAVVSLQYVYTLEKAAELFEAFNMNDVATDYKNISANLRKAVYQKCFDKSKGLIADSPEKATFSQHANALAITTNTFPEKMDKSAVVNTLLNDKELAPCSLYFSFYLFEALEMAGKADLFTNSLQPWEKMLASGLTTFAERPDPTRSDCHAWSASPVYFFLSLVSGIKPATPGFDSVLIEPNLGNLKNIDATMPHKLGSIHVKLHKNKDNHLMGEITLPHDLTGVFIGNGEKIQLHDGINVIE